MGDGAIAKKISNLHELPQLCYYNLQSTEESFASPFHNLSSGENDTIYLLEL